MINSSFSNNPFEEDYKNDPYLQNGKLTTNCPEKKYIARSRIDWNENK